MADTGKIAGLIVTYFPDQDLPDRIDKLLEQVDRLVVVDNGSPPDNLRWAPTYEDLEHVTIIRNADNLGIATALNQGIRALSEEGYDWVITMDQDSEVADGCVSALTEAVSAAPDPGKVALVGSNRFDHGAYEKHRWLRPKRGLPFFERVTCDQAGPDGVTLVITSGTLTNIAVLNQLGGFRGDLFIDLVDSEYCLRARKAGFTILVSCQAQLAHQIGEKKQRNVLGLTLSPMHHSAFRKYYIFRNSIVVVRTYGLAFPHWLIFHILALIEIFVGLILFEEAKTAKLKACFSGVFDGLLNRTGKTSRNF